VNHNNELDTVRKNINEWIDAKFEKVRQVTHVILEMMEKKSESHTESQLWNLTLKPSHCIEVLRLSGEMLNLKNKYLVIKSTPIQPPFPSGGVQFRSQWTTCSCGENVELKQLSGWRSGTCECGITHRVNAGEMIIQQPNQAQ